MQRIAIIGSGATALAALDALSDEAGIHLTLIRTSLELEPKASESEPPAHYRQGAEETITALRSELGLKFPPPKSRFGMLPDILPVKGWGNIWRSNLHGGLTQFWGGSMVPFTDRELARWPIGREHLDTDYGAIAALAGVTGANDALREYLHDDFAILPPVEPIPAIGRLISSIRSADMTKFDIAAGAARVAVETRAGRPNACTYTGECMTGCSQDAVFNARTAIDQHRNGGLITAECRGEARYIDLERKTVGVRLDAGGFTRLPYDLVFICAGCVHSTQLLMNSLSAKPETLISDNTILSFPVFYGGHVPTSNDHERYFALTNGMLLFVPRDTDTSPVFIQLYPNPDYFWQYNLPRRIWPAVRRLARTARNRLFWGRAYIEGEKSQGYGLDPSVEETSLTVERRPDLARFRTEVWPQIRASFAASNFWIPPVGPLKAKTSAHYAGGFPMGGAFVDSDGALGHGAYLCDSANFPDCPSLSHTMTAMANARRIVRTAVRR